MLTLPPAPFCFVGTQGFRVRVWGVCVFVLEDGELVNRCPLVAREKNSKHAPIPHWLSPAPKLGCKQHQTTYYVPGAEMRHRGRHMVTTLKELLKNKIQLSKS